MLPRIQPINHTRIAQPFDHLDWIFQTALRTDCRRGGSNPRPNGGKRLNLMASSVGRVKVTPSWNTHLTKYP
jgi:hypothetical protein